MSKPLTLALCATLATAGLAQAADEDFAEFADGYAYKELRLGLVSMQHLEIEETAESNSGFATDYEWGGVDRRGRSFGIELIGGKAHDWGGFWGGLGLNYAFFDATPSYYKVGPVAYLGSSGQLNVRTFMANVSGGYQVGIIPQGRLRVHWEIGPTLGLGFTHAETESVSAYGYAETNGDLGFAFEMGLRTGVYITENRWLLGLTLSATRMWSKVVIDTVDGNQSEVRPESRGFHWGIQAGYRF